MDQSSWKQQYRWLPALVLLCCLPAGAATVYRTVDENGVVSFSDMRPAGDTPVETMVINAQAPQASEAAQQRLQDMRETTDRMAADRMAREKHRAEIRQLQAQAQPRYDYQYPRESNPQYLGFSSGYSGYSSYPSRPWRRSHKRRSQHPVARPPLRQPGYKDHPSMIRTSLPGNNYPASLIRKSYNPRVRQAFRN
jgi:hypothetical protein